MVFYELVMTSYVTHHGFGKRSVTQHGDELHGSPPPSGLRDLRHYSAAFMLTAKGDFRHVFARWTDLPPMPSARRHAAGPR